MDDLITLKTLGLATARRLAEAAVSRAGAMGLRIHVHVVDHAGEPLVYLRMPGAPPPARLVSERKACTAASYRQPTAAWKDKLAHKPHVAMGLAAHPRIALIGGGVPILHDGTVVGAIGVAGALEEQDMEIAAAALAEVIG
ncbi:GlcG/HbpS family heme-binding protein [Azospirillum halopraeferens]|uniref:GlcG/HbpS family heme-binding protein n=1 Tax=Azospirillum halopraeferens TaxID=34010 RepID=UPI00055492AA|nr:heme-binding protein [Azospirillum halopraeferens]